VNFEFAAPRRIVFGEGRVAEAGEIAAGLGTRALLVEGSSGRGEPLIGLLAAKGIEASRLPIPAEPSVDLMEKGVRQAREEGCDLVVAVGGGSVIDSGKAIAALLTNPGSARDYLEVIGEGRALTERAAPMIAVPTTAGTGSEVTRNAVLSAGAERIKVSLRSPLMIPTVALIDPELTYSLPPPITASTGMDALTQCLEPFVSPHASPLSDAFAREGLRRIAGAIRRAFGDGADVEARRDMAIASLCGGLALANARLGAVHGFAAPLGGMFPIPHGVACARMLAPVTEVNVRALRVRDPDSPALTRFDEAARILTGYAGARAEYGVSWLRSLQADLQIPSLATFGLSRADLEEVVGKARRSSSMQGNPVALTDAELFEAMGGAL
jgi:alcohol dehydrogenase class IV